MDTWLSRAIEQEAPTSKSMIKWWEHVTIEGRGLGSALILEFLLYYLTKPEYQLHVREEIYLDNMLDLF